MRAEGSRQTRLPKGLEKIAKLVGVGRSRRKRMAKGIRRWLRPAWLGTAHWRTRPFSDMSGYDRGVPIDRVYIHRFLDEHRSLIRGRVLEVQNSQYTDALGEDVDSMEVLDIDPANSRATLIGDLANPPSLPEKDFDCFILTQTLQYIFDPRSAVVSAHRVLRPGGVVLATVPAVSKVDAKTPELDFWRFTEVSCARLFEEVFGADRIEVRTYGNVLAASAFLMGMAAEDVRRRDLDRHDPRFPVIVAVRARRSRARNLHDCAARPHRNPGEAREQA